MIFYYFLLGLVTFLNAIAQIFPKVTELPFGLDAIMAQAFGMFHELITILPWLGVIFQAFVLYYTFKMTMWFLHLFRIIK